VFGAGSLTVLFNNGEAGTQPIEARHKNIYITSDEIKNLL
jgi:hypothetical protein